MTRMRDMNTTNWVTVFVVWRLEFQTRVNPRMYSVGDFSGHAWSERGRGFRMIIKADKITQITKAAALLHSLGLIDTPPHRIIEKYLEMKK